MLTSEHGYHHSDSDSLIAARAALWQATAHRDRPLLDHIEAYLSDGRMLAEALRAINAAAEERHSAAAEARRLWPILMDFVLDFAVDNRAAFTNPHWGDYALAGLIPNPTYPEGYLTSELAGEPDGWRDLIAWSPQIDRWLEFAVGNRKSIDALVIAVPGMWVARNVTSLTAQVVAAAASGSRAAIAINADLVQDDVQRAVTLRRAPFSADSERQLCEQ